jgi:hypothetical protein
MTKNKLLHTIRLENILSYSTEMETLTFSSSNKTLRYQLSFTCTGNRFELVDESITESLMDDSQKPLTYYAYQNGYPILNTLIDSEQNLRKERQLQLLPFYKNVPHVPN